MRIGLGGFQENKSVREHQLDEEYNSEDLGSDIQGDDNFSKYKSDYMRVKTKFKIRMKFYSLKEAQQTIREHAFFNGRQVEFVKNDRV